MRGHIATTDYDWYEFLRSQNDLDEGNFWRPSGKGSSIEPGSPFFFELKAAHNAIRGFGFSARASVIPATLAWEAFTTRNGAPTERAMRERIEEYRKAPPAEHGDYAIGCLMIAQPVFFPPGQGVAQPKDWDPQLVSSKSYDLAAGEGRRVWEECLIRAQSTPSAQLVASEAQAVRYCSPTLIRPRLGQGFSWLP